MLRLFKCPKCVFTTGQQMITFSLGKSMKTHLENNYTATIRKPLCTVLYFHSFFFNTNTIYIDNSRRALQAVYILLSKLTGHQVKSVQNWRPLD